MCISVNRIGTYDILFHFHVKISFSVVYYNIPRRNKNLFNSQVVYEFSTRSRTYKVNQNNLYIPHVHLYTSNNNKKIYMSNK